MIEVELYLYAYLRRHCPEAGLGQPVVLKVQDKTAVGELLDHVGIPKETRRVVFVNGVIQPDTYALSAGDRIAAFPPLAGGCARERGA